MAYMRGTPYIWSDGERLHINDTSITMDEAHELAAMLWAEVSDTGRRGLVMKRTVQSFGGNGGCDALCRLMGEPTMMQRALDAMALNADGDLDA